MRAVELPRRPRVLALLLILVVTFGGGLALPAAAQVATPTPAAAPSRGADSSSTTESSVPPLAEAYLLLLERYALPLDAAQLIDAGQAGMVAVLKAAGVDVEAAAAGAYGTSTVEQFAVLQSQFQALAARYGDRVTPRQLAYAAIRGMADSVGDAHTNFLTPDEYQEQQRWERGDVRYGGIGARMRGPQATVVEVFPDTPAERAGLQPGDTIVAVDGQSATDLKLDEVIRLVRGTEGTPVVLRVQRAAGGRVEDLTLVRAQVAAPFVSARRLPGNLGYVQLRGFPEASVIAQVEQAILQQQREGARGIVLDLRGNSGGRLGVGERLLSRFVPDGPIYQIVDRSGQRDVQSVRGARPILTVPLAVLVDSGTASMGEVFAAAIEEHHVGRVIGTTTAGAVAASRFIPLSDGSALQISLEQVYSGAGAPLDRVGVQPDEEVDLDLDALRQGRDSQLERATSYLLASAAAAATR
jgi:carboxyl-terminal processing protease